MLQIAFILLVLVGTNWLALKMIYESGSAGLAVQVLKSILLKLPTKYRVMFILA